MISPDRLYREPNFIKNYYDSPLSSWNLNLSGIIQTILIPTKYNYYSARQWLENHGYKTTKTDITTNYYRFRQKEPDYKKTYYAKKLTNGIIFIFFR